MRLPFQSSSSHVVVSVYLANASDILILVWGMLIWNPLIYIYNIDMFIRWKNRCISHINYPQIQLSRSLYLHHFGCHSHANPWKASTLWASSVVLCGHLSDLLKSSEGCHQPRCVLVVHSHRWFSASCGKTMENSSTLILPVTKTVLTVCYLQWLKTKMP